MGISEEQQKEPFRCVKLTSKSMTRYTSKFDARLLRDKAAIELAGAPRELKQLKANIQSFMSMLQKTPGRVVKYFNSTKLHYCA